MVYKKMINKYYQKHKGKHRKEARERYQNLSEEEKDKRRKKLRERYPNIPEEQKQKLLEYIKKYCLAQLSPWITGEFKNFVTI